MAMREIIIIDENTCNGCGICASKCPEGALQIIDGKARMVGENLCDGLGACVGECPIGAIQVVKKECQEYEENEVMQRVHAQGKNVVRAHIAHLEHHGQTRYVREAYAWLAANDAQMGKDLLSEKDLNKTGHCECPGSATRVFKKVAKEVSKIDAGKSSSTEEDSALSNWPIQLQLANPNNPLFEDAELLIAADCTAFSLGRFHSEVLEGKALVIACPKLDSDREGYIEKMSILMKVAKTITIAIMEVPCCSGLVKLATSARLKLSPEEQKKILVKVISTQGKIIQESSI